MPPAVPDAPPFDSGRAVPPPPALQAAAAKRHPEAPTKVKLPKRFIPIS